MNTSSRPRWSKSEIAYLETHYGKTPLDDMVKHLGRSPESIKLKGQRTGLRRHHDVYRRSNVSPLVEKTPDALYWLGFLLADGHFTRDGRLIVRLARKDEAHLRKLAAFLSTPNVRTSERVASLTVMNRDLLPDLMKSYEINSQKTRSPPNITALTTEDKRAMMIGFFDGDGSIWKRPNGSAVGAVKCHVTWLPILLAMRECLTIKGSLPSVKSSGYAEWRLSNSQLKEMDGIARAWGLPVLGRKWSLLRE